MITTINNINNKNLIRIDANTKKNLSGFAP